jgi:uncharacterized protein DUF4440
MVHRTSLPALLALLALPAFAAPRGDEASARAATLARFDAALRADVATLDRQLADDLDYCSFRGLCATKAEYLALVKSGRVKYLSGTPTIDRVKLYADTATVLGHANVTIVRDGVQQTIDLSWAAVMVWRDARWQLTTWTATQLETPPK